GVMLRVDLDAFGQRARREHLILRDDVPLSVAIAPPEAIRAAFGGDAERDRLPLRRRARLLERPGEARGFLLQQVAIIAIDAQGHERCGDAEEQQHDEHLHQGEAAPLRPGRRPQPRRYSCHEPMSASAPLPPGLPSAPRLNTSISPCSPGFKYW